MSQITTHVLDTAKGKPAEGIPISLYFQESDSEWQTLGSGTTNSDGRVTDLLTEDHKIKPGIYKILFNTKSYLSDGGFFPEIPIIFEIKDCKSHYHVPLLLSPYGFSTYRGS